MKKKITTIILTSTLVLPTATTLADYQYTVVSGDTLWKIAVKTETGISELIASNTQISNINLIYPGQKINIPTQDDIKAYEQKVIQLVNAERTKQGLKELQYDWELARVARYKSEDMRDQNYFSHESPIYGSPFEMIKKHGSKAFFDGKFHDIPNTVARAIPASVPRHAQAVFLFTPPIMINVASVIRTATAKVVGIVGAPLSSRGRSIHISAATVRTSETILFAPTLPPTRTVTSRNTTIIATIHGILLYSYT